MHLNHGAGFICLMLEPEFDISSHLMNQILGEQGSTVWLIGSSMLVPAIQVSTTSICSVFRIPQHPQLPPTYPVVPWLAQIPLQTQVQTVPLALWLPQVSLTVPLPPHKASSIFSTPCLPPTAALVKTLLSKWL